MKGLLFTKPNRIANRNGSKSQTRRIVKGLVDFVGGHQTVKQGYLWSSPKGWIKIPYTVGEIAFVREPWCVHQDYDRCNPVKTQSSQYSLVEIADEYGDATLGLHYLDDGPKPEGDRRTRSPLHLPAAFAKDFVRITGIRAERLQDISDAGCFAEGIHSIYARIAVTDGPIRVFQLPGPERITSFTPRWAYRQIWESIHGPGSWRLNPWVWVIDYELISQAEGLGAI